MIMPSAVIGDSQVCTVPGVLERLDPAEPDPGDDGGGQQDRASDHGDARPSPRSAAARSRLRGWRMIPTKGSAISAIGFTEAASAISRRRPTSTRGGESAGRQHQGDHHRVVVAAGDEVHDDQRVEHGQPDGLRLVDAVDVRLAAGRGRASAATPQGARSGT